MITIIGAGPIGSYTAWLLSKNFDVQLFEEHTKIGKPVQCTGLTTSSIKEMIKLKNDLIINEMDKVEITSPNNSVLLNLKDKEPVLDRKKFDNFLADKATDSGTKLFLNHRFIEHKKDYAIIKDLKNNKIKKIKTNILIGADGPLSPVAKSTNLFQNREFLVGLQARVRIKNTLDINIYKTYFGKICPGFFAWFVPEKDNIARIGLATKKNTRLYFDNFLKKFKGKTIEKQLGLIPVYNKKTKIQKNNIYLIGDAACQIKNTTGGGIIPGLMGAKILVDAITNKKSYEKEFNNKIGKELLLHSKIRRVLNKFSDNDYNYMVNLLKNKKTKHIIEKHDREFPSKFLLKLLLKEPRFLYFFKKLF